MFGTSALLTLLRTYAPPFKVMRHVKRKGAITSKKGPTSFRKGRGGIATGFKDSEGMFHPLWWKQPTYAVPDLTNCDLKPYVSLRAPRNTKEFRRWTQGQLEIPPSPKKTTTPPPPQH
eukprot:TRINITY_DN488_c0_g1::TRINITY_DN488_c0_g1_i1::g.2480::m.2480 TRINITY_DN488_c0_g1::TRINITY_DN488_c0_g1_i1::g.2480  ORF type:complete len:134 (-),score=-1.53,sp/Q6DJI4/RM41A_XENLA/41.67/7e-11,MRP-L27/PF09809.4/1.1e-17 TRINITY_DN488_c0_g1_i1:163-516(-)